MGEIKEFRGDLETIMPPAVKGAIEQLRGGHGKNYSKILGEIREVEISAENKAVLVDALFADIQSQIERGQFREIERAKELMNFLGVKEFALSPEAEQTIVRLYNKYSYDFLSRMSPPLYDGKLASGEAYDEIVYVRKMMRDAGEDPSDEDIKELWQYREILVKLHYGNWKPQNQLNEIPRLLAEQK